jgi:Zn-dependent alcohol dehydrogenase
MTSNIYRSNKAANDREGTTLSARIHQYQNPLTIEEIPKPMITSGQQVLVKVAASGLCHSDLHLINGEWKDVLPIPLPITRGHEVATSGVLVVVGLFGNQIRMPLLSSVINENQVQCSFLGKL